MSSRTSKHDQSLHRARRKRPAAGRKRTAARAKKAKTSAKTRRRATKPPPDDSRLERFITTQQHVIERVSNYAEQVVDMTTKGQFTPTSWIKETAGMWRDLAGDLAQMTRVILKD